MKFSFCDRHENLGCLFVFCNMQNFESSRCGHFLFTNVQPILEGCNIRLCHNSMDSGIVGFRNMTSRCQKTVIQCTVICDQQQTFGVFIQPSHRGQPTAQIVRQIIHYGFIPTIFGGSNASSRFVQHQIMVFLISDGVSIQTNTILLRITFFSTVRYKCTVFCNTFHFNQFFTLRTGCYLHLREKFINANHMCFSFCHNFLSISL